MAKLVIVESPSKAKTIKKYLGGDYEVIASQGHVVDLPSSKLAVDVDNDFKPEYKTMKGKAGIIKEIKDHAKGKDVVYLATDPDREGEAIAWHLKNLLNIDDNEKCRIEFNEITKNAVKKAVEKDLDAKLALGKVSKYKRENTPEKYLEAGAPVVNDFQDFCRCIAEIPGTRSLNNEQLKLF